MEYLTDYLPTLLLGGVLFFWVFRRGGCCGGSHSHQSTNQKGSSNHGEGCCGGGHSDSSETPKNGKKQNQSGH